MTTVASLAACLAILVSVVGAQTGPRGEAVDWLQGCWQMDAPGRTVEEQWMAPRGGTMLGVGRTVRGTTLSDYEFVLIRERGVQLSYEAHPADQPPAIFMSKTLTDRSVVFENLRDDFPQRIGYERRSDTELFAWIEGSDGGARRRVEFPYRRVTCAGY